MKFDTALIGELQTIFAEDYGVELSEGEAAQVGTSIVRFFEQLDRMHEKKRNP